MNLRLHRLPAVAVASLLVLLCACSSKADRIESGLRKAADFVKASDWDKANVEMRNVLQIDPKNARAYLLSAQVAEGQNNIQRAYSSYLKSLELDPSSIPAKVGLARIYLVAGEAPKAQAAIDDVLKIEPANAGARSLQAAMTARGGDVKKAIEQARAIAAVTQPVPVEVSSLLAGLYIAQGDSAKAMSVIDAALAVEPKNINLLLVAAQIAGSDGIDAPIAAKAPDYFRRATAQTPKNDELWNAWATLHVRRGQPDLAESVLREAIKAQPDDNRRVLTLLDFVNAKRGYADAEKELATAIAQRPRDTDLRFALVKLHRSAGRPVEAQRVLQQIIDQASGAPSALAARDQLAADRIAAGRFDDARVLIADVLKVNPRDGGALVLRGRMLLHELRPKDAIADLRAAARDQPGSAEVAGLLAVAHTMAGEPELAREALADAVKFKPDDPALRMLMAAQMADAKEFKGAEAELDAALKVAPALPRLYEMKAQVQFAQHDIAGAESTLVALKQQLPRDSIGFLRLGQFYSDQKRLDAALKEFDAGSVAFPGEPTLFLSSVGVLVSQKRFGEVDARLDTLAKAEPRSPLPFQVRGDVAARRGDSRGAEAAYRKQIEIAPNVAQGYQGLARTLAGRGDMPAALATLQQGEVALPLDAGLTSARADLLARAGRSEEAEKAYESILARMPDDEAANNNLAYLLVQKKGDKSRVQRAASLVGRFTESSNPSYLDTLGWVQYVSGDFAKAVPVLERAVALAPTSPLLNLHLGKALVKAGDARRGKDLLRKAIDSKVDLPDLDEARAMLAQG